LPIIGALAVLWGWPPPDDRGQGLPGTGGGGRYFRAAAATGVGKPLRAPVGGAVARFLQNQRI